MEIDEMPDWLQTLWNINPSLAKKAEKDIERLKYFEDIYNSSQLLFIEELFGEK